MPSRLYQGTLVTLALSGIQYSGDDMDKPRCSFDAATAVKHRLYGVTYYITVNKTLIWLP